MTCLPKTVPTMTTNGPVDFFDHYKVIAKDYDNFHQTSYEAVIPILSRKLDLQPHHLVADVGSGTGFIAEKLFEASKLETPIWCVDPSTEMQKLAQRRIGVNPVLKSAEEFFDDSENSGRFDRVFSIGAVHHFLRPLEVFKAIERSLRPGGTCLFFVTGETSQFPLFNSADKLMAVSLNGLKEHFICMLQEADFDTEGLEEQVNYNVTKSQWYQMLRGRWWSNFIHLSDEQIEDGINELENDKFSRVKVDDSINFYHSWLILVAKKRDK